MSFASQAQDLLAQTNCRYVPAFFLGAVFVAALESMASSLLFKDIFNFVTVWMKATRTTESRDAESLSEKAHSTDISNSMASSLCIGDNRTLLFILAFCFASASITFFASLLWFAPGAGAACAFVVAWGGIASQTGSMVALVVLLLELRRLGIRKWESIFFILWLVTAAVFMFVNNALATGVTVEFPDLGVVLCNRKHFLATSLVSSLIYIVLEGYTLFRFWSLLLPAFLQLQHQLAGFSDFRLKRSCALLLFQFLTVVPAAVPTNVLGDFLPFGIGSLIVIWTFRMHVLAVDESSSAMSISADRECHWSVRDAPTVYSLPSDEVRPSCNHPYSSKSLSDPTRDWAEPPRTARSSRTIDSVSARSMRNAIVQVAKRAAHPFDQATERLPVPVSPRGSGRTFTSQNGSTLKLELDTKIPLRAVARPRLVIMTGATEKNRLESVGGFRLTPSFIPKEGSHLSMTSSSNTASTRSRWSGGSVSVPTTPSEERSRRTTWTTFGMRVQSRWSLSTNGTGTQPRASGVQGQ